jgi:putative tryptophan/tyrosine transport system substrate-binding protein
MQTQKSRIGNLGIALFLMILPRPHVVEAQQPSKVPRIGYLAQRNTPTPATPDPAADAFQQGLRDLGYLEGKTILVEYRYAGGSEDRLRALVAELVQLKVDVLVSPALPVIRAAKQATKTIPIIMVTTADPVATGLVDSLARPGGNVTGLTRLTRELSGKRLELLKEAVPGVSRVGIIWDASGLTTDASFKNYQAAARALNVRLQSLEVRGPPPGFGRCVPRCGQGARERAHYW